MHAIFAFEIAVGIFATLNLHGYALDTSLIALLQVTYRNPMTMCLGPAHVHTHQHLRPILTLRTACARVNFKYTVHGIFLLAEHIHQFEVLDGSYRLAIVLVNLFFRYHIVVVEVKSQLQFVCSLAHFLISHNPFFNALYLLHLLLSTCGIVPEVGCLCS